MPVSQDDANQDGLNVNVWQLDTARDSKVCNNTLALSEALFGQPFGLVLVR